MPRMQTVSLRFCPNLWERCGWQATAMKVDRSEFVRDTLEGATKNAKPPIPRQFRGVSGSPSQMELWDKAAAQLEVPTEEFARQAMDYAAKRLFQRKAVAGGAQEQS